MLLFNEYDYKPPSLQFFNLLAAFLMTRFFKSSFGATLVPEPAEKFIDGLGEASLLPKWSADVVEEEVLALGVVLPITGLEFPKLKDGCVGTFADEDEPKMLGWLAWKLNGVAVCPPD